ncbi:MAG: DNA repair protein RecO [Cohaesibacter sp.]|nr:DNA repair protein RecO [Cohaesibacter sp.]MCV6600605.1 DNA repair protein RecO [Cohaesibacter sp.]
MEWTSEAIILGTRSHGERAVILEVMTAQYGRHLGVVRSGRSKQMQPVLQIGNSVQVTWKARIESHLGQFTVEPVRSRAAQLMETPLGTYGIQFLTELLRLLPERDPHPYLHQALSVIVDEFTEADIAAELMIRFELALLAELGFGLELQSCAATGKNDDLAYVSPKSGRAICRDAGRPYHDRLLALPHFLLGQGTGNRLAFSEIEKGFHLTDFFLKRYIYQPREQSEPAMRESFINCIKAQLSLD